MGGTPWQRVSSAVIGGFASLGLPIFEESQVGRQAPDGLHIFNTRSTREDRNWVEYELKRSLQPTSSTHVCYKTPKYEGHRPLGVRDRAW